MNNPDQDAAKIGPLSPEDEKNILILIRLAVITIKSAFEHFLGTSQARFLLILFLQREGEVTQSDIQKRLGVDRAMITRLVKQMEAEGLVVRRPNPADNRFTFVRLSERGMEEHALILSRLQELDNVLLQDMSAEEMRSLQTGLGKIRRNAERISAERILSFDPLTEECA